MRNPLSRPASSERFYAGAMERTFDRVPSRDPRRAQYPLRTLLDQAGATQPRSYTWRCDVVLDQGSEGACVGFAWAHERNARPAVRRATGADADRLYRLAQTMDEWAGEAYEGTSVNGGARAAAQLRWIGAYRWTTNVDDLALAIGHHGPAVIGVNWYEGMFDPDHAGQLHVAGDIAGGHAILVRGVSVTLQRFLVHNSWGRSWGGTDKGPGTAWLSFADMGRLMDEDGEACIPVARF